MVTCQPAVELSIPRAVAFNAEIHLETDRRKTIQSLHSAMALDAFNIAPLDVRLMFEFHEVGNIKDPDPGNRICGVEISPFLPDLRMQGDDIFMAEEAFLHSRNPGPGGTGNKGMAETAVDRLHSRMHPVAEGNRLRRTKLPMGVYIKEKGHPRPKENHKYGPWNPRPFFQRILVSPFHHRSHSLSNSGVSYSNPPSCFFVLFVIEQAFFTTKETKSTKLKTSTSSSPER